MTTPTLASCIGLDRWFADPRTTASLGLQRLKSHVRAGVGEIMEGAPTLVTGNRQDDPHGSRNHPIKSYAYRGAELMLVLRTAALIGLALSIVWLFKNPGFEPALACIGAISTLGGLAFKDHQKSLQRSNVQNQAVSGASSGIQAGGNISINTRPKERNE